MIFGHVHPYLRRKTTFTDGDKYGANVAHHDMLAGSLKWCDSIEAAHILYYPQHVDEEGVSDIQAEYGADRVQIYDIRELSRLASRHEYVFPVVLPIYLRLAQLRRISTSTRFPLCLITHSISSHVGASSNLELLSLFEPYDALVTSSEAGRRSLMSILDETIELGLRMFGGTRRPEPRILKIPLGVDTEYLKVADQQDCRSRLNLPMEARVILYLGRLSATFKADLAPLLQVISALVDEGRNLFLVIAGSDNGKDYGRVIQNLGQHLGISDRIKIIPNFSPNQKPIIYGAADIFVSPADNIQETFGLSIIEAMACGLPVVASDWSGYREIVLNGETGFLAPTVWADEAGRKAAVSIHFPYRASEYFLAQHTVVDIGQLHQKLTLLLDNDELRRSFGERGRRRAVEIYSWPVVIRQFEQLWIDQQREAKHQQKQHPLPYPGDYNKMFSHFASTRLSDALVIKTGRHFSKWTPEDPKHPLTAMIGHGDFATVLALCAERPRRVGDIIGEVGIEAYLTIAHLIKKGALEIVDNA
jgi:D-inositol-3-phosphate glycosyltransferase